MRILRTPSINILALDGGGIRGIVPARILEGIRQRLLQKGHTGNLCRRFHLIAGTSVGGLITLGLTMPAEKGSSRPLMQPGELADLMNKEGDAIFPQNHRLPATYLAQAVRRKYGDKSVNRFLLEILGERSLHDAMTNILLTSYDTENREPYFFKKRPARHGGSDDPDFLARDAARAAIAAPTFFAPAHVAPMDDPDNRRCLIDGGIFVNNPALVAYIEARKIFPRAKRFRIVSLGTGCVDKPYDYQDVRNWGFINWMAAAPSPPLLDMMVDGQSDNVNHMLERLPGVEFHRIDFPLDEKHAAMDDVRPFNIEYLEDKAARIMEKRASDLARICDMLQAPGQEPLQTLKMKIHPGISGQVSG